MPAHPVYLYVLRCILCFTIRRHWQEADKLNVSLSGIFLTLIKGEVRTAVSSDSGSPSAAVP